MPLSQLETSSHPHHRDVAAVRSLMILSDLARKLSATWDLLDAPTREEALGGLSAACSDVQRWGSGGQDPPVLPELDEGGSSDSSDGSVISNELLLRQLTPRERDILAAIGSGASTVQMAEQLGISRDTVRSHVKNVLAKLQVHSRLEAAMMARTTTPS
jgi:DNA-binding CsgD family transcriptional regulator